MNGSGKTLVACHRGAHGGNILPNTVKSCLCAFAQGADIAEIDAVRSSDGVYYVFHDTEEACTFGFLNNLRNLTSAQIDRLRMVNRYGCFTEQKVPRLEEVLLAVKGKGMINLDRCWGGDFAYTAGALDLIGKCGMSDSVIFKSGADEKILAGLKDYPNIRFMGIVSSVEEAEKIEQSGANVVGYELLFATPKDEVLSLISRFAGKNYLFWANAIDLNDTAVLAGGMHDEGALLEDPDAHWGALVEAGFNVIQTDFPRALKDYLVKKGY